MYKIYKSRAGNSYIYDNVTNNIYSVDRNDIENLPEIGDTSLLERIDSKFYKSIYSDDMDFSVLSCRPKVESGTDMPEVLVIELTQQCNFRCEYCVYSGNYFYERTHNNECISDALIDQIVHKFFKNKDYPKNVSFYGGDPLLKFDVIEKFVHSIEKLGLDVDYFITTNGALLTDRNILDFFVSYGFHINISFDGLNNDLYRKRLDGGSSSAMVESVIKELYEINPKYVNERVKLSVTLTPPYRLYDNAKYFEEHPIYSKLNMLVNTVNIEDNDFICNFEMEEENKRMREDYLKLADCFIDTDENDLSHFLKALFLRPLLRIEERKMGIPSEMNRVGCCIPGKQRLYINTEGDYFMCERVGNYSKLGSVTEGLSKPSVIAAQNEFDNLIWEKCSTCYLSRICNFCFSVFREGHMLTSEERVNRICNRQKEWFDFLFYVFLSKKELEDE